MPRRTAAPPRRGLSLGVLIVNQLLAGVGVASGMALAAILVADLSGVVAMGGLAQSSSVLGAALAAIPLARLAVRSGRHVALATGYAFAFVGAVLVIAAATSGWPVLVFLGLAAFGAGRGGRDCRRASPPPRSRLPASRRGRCRSCSWATTIGSVAGPLLSQTGDDMGRALGLPPLVGPFIFSAIAFAVSSILVATLLRTPPAGHLATDAGPSTPAPSSPIPAPRRSRPIPAPTPSRPNTSPTQRAPPPPRPASARGRRCGSPSATPPRSSRSSPSCARTRSWSA